MGSAPLAGSPIGSGVGAGVGTVATASDSVAEAVGVAAMENKNVPLELGSIAESEPEYIYPGEVSGVSYISRLDALKFQTERIFRP